jgi:predicted ABC-type ATPase
VHVIDGLERRIGAAWALVAEAIMRCEQATVYDNSGIKGLRIVAEMTQGFVVGSPGSLAGFVGLTRS